MKQTAFSVLLALLCCLPANAQDLVLLFESEPGTRPSSIFTDGFESSGTRLYDSSGNDRLILTREDNNGNLQAIRVVDIVSGNTLWEVQDITQELGLDGQQVWRQLGFADPDGDGEREAIFASSQEVVLINPSDNSLSFRTLAPSMLVGVLDLTGDGFSELILFQTEILQVQVWGKAN